MSKLSLDNIKILEKAGLPLKCEQGHKYHFEVEDKIIYRICVICLTRQIVPLRLPDVWKLKARWSGQKVKR